MQQKRNQQAEIRLGSHGEDYGSWMSNPVFYIIGGITALAVVLAILSFSVFHITALGVLFSVVTAALAALLPNTFLQALVWQALTAPELPEVTEHEDL